MSQLRQRPIYQKQAIMTAKEEARFMKTFRDTACECCGVNDGTVVAAHFNKFGGGTGYRAKGVVAGLCGLCHDIADGRRGTPEEQRIVWWRVLHKALQDRAREWMSDE